MDEFRQFWAKARPKSAEGPRFHPIWAHGLDVAAAGEALLDAYPQYASRAAQSLNWGIGEFTAIWLHLLALHDIGKFAPQFQNKVPELYPVSVGKDEIVLGSRDLGHPAAGLALLRASFFSDETGIPAHPIFEEWKWKHAGLLFGPILGHHGRPILCPKDADAIFRPSIVARHALDFWSTIAELLPVPPITAPRPSTFHAASWSIAGLTALADWIGSNAAWFPYVDAKADLAAYWDEARERARYAMVQAGLRSARSAALMSFKTLTGIGQQPTDAQHWAEKTSLPEGPLLMIIEDVTGGGKTEAALMLAHRLISAQRATGVYLALPTMATANAMFDRLKQIVPRFFLEGGKPSLTLAHGAAAFHSGYRVPWRVGEPDPTLDSGDSARTASEWLMSESRKALLADIGVGTIDQALLAVLPARYQAVRLVGLTGKILIVDEAHAYDAYMARELDRLLAFHAAQGGSAIILSATLPKAVKRRFADAWQATLDQESNDIDGDPYPGATLVSAAGVCVAPLCARSELARTLTLTRIGDQASAVSMIIGAARKGAAVAWIRNTVDDAISGAELLRSEGIAAALFHARFAMCDRLEIEKDAIRRFGKNSEAFERQGRVLVATQVIEQSLDLDFDLIVSDLAPFDLLLQRAGRLWRHPHRRRPIAGPQMLVLSPDPDGSIAADWLGPQARGTGIVYGDHGVLWRSARVIAGQSRFKVPQDVRGAIEAVYASDDSDIPDALQRARSKALGEKMAQRAFADANLLSVEKGYVLLETAWENETRAATRLSEEVRTLRLARVAGDRLVPYAEDPDPARAWALSEVRVHARKVAGHLSPPPEFATMAQVARSGWSRFDEGVVLVVLLGNEQACEGSLIDAEGGERKVRYAKACGFQVG